MADAPPSTELWLSAVGLGTATLMLAGPWGFEQFVPGASTGTSCSGLVDLHDQFGLEAGEPRISAGSGRPRSSGSDGG